MKTKHQNIFLNVFSHLLPVSASTLFPHGHRLCHVGWSTGLGAGPHVLDCNATQIWLGHPSIMPIGKRLCHYTTQLWLRPPHWWRYAPTCPLLAGPSQNLTGSQLPSNQPTGRQ
ncbi:hypothetical protein KIL84_012879 [Mauremys mutica]|uniref:Secreted protein n=1 Tax=Mauremys mutica TaxID=74926 RepID=A0A9D3XRU5_9SAUR|nr:hypothetical protein KIL84_012879 [Mauremys mutica]